MRDITKEKNNVKIKRIYKKAVAIELRQLGFRIIGTEVNPIKPQFDVYLFEDTEEFEKGMSKAILSYQLKKELVTN